LSYLKSQATLGTTASYYIKMNQYLFCLFQEEQINPDPEGWVLEMLTDPNIKVVVVEDVDSTRTFDPAIFNKKSLEGSSLLDTSSET